MQGTDNITQITLLRSGVELEKLDESILKLIKDGINVIRDEKELQDRNILYVENSRFPSGWI
jgi:hypothetical protein